MVTGGASGIGNAIAMALAARGARVAIVDVRADGATAAAADAPGAATGLHAGFGCDVTDETSVARTVAEVIARFGRIDVLVNCAGIAALAPADELSAETWSRTIDVNLTGTFRVAQAVGRHMLAAGYGRVVNIASQAAHVGIDGHAAYCASKGAVAALTRAIAIDHVAEGIRCNAVAPGTIDTPYFDEILRKSPVAADSRKALEARQLLGRLGTPEEIAAGILFLASDESRFATGSILTIDGGMTAQ